MSLSAIRYPLDQAQAVAAEILGWLGPDCERVAVAGSIRRQKPTVGDVEIVAIARQDSYVPEGEMLPVLRSALNYRVQRLVTSKQLLFRPKKDGTIANGAEIKLLVHAATGMPVDLFITVPEHWFSLLVCRTGGKRNNEELATLAKRHGYRWMMNGAGFRHLTTGKVTPITCEEDAYTFLNLTCPLPHYRH